MSYILEALKKSDQQRQQGAMPTLTSVQLPVEESSERTFPWLAALAAMVFIAGVLIGWLQPWRSEPPAAPVLPVAKRPPVQVVAANLPGAASAPLNAPVEPGTGLIRNQGQIQPPQPAPAASRPSAPAPAVQAALPRPTPIVAPLVKNDSPTAAVRIPAAALRQPEPAAPAKPAVVAEQNVMAKEDLPPAILQELPAMAVSLHAYSAKPGNRLVSINNQLLQEGDELVPGLTLEKITPKDMIFTYKGFRFRQGVH